MSMFKVTARLGALAAALALGACATYQTPGAGVNLGDLSKADEDIAEVMKRQPAAAFPARIAVARAQAAGYSSHGADCYGRGRYCIVTAREFETDADLEHIGSLPMVAAVAPMSRMIIPGNLGALKDLRLGAASLRADMLLVYSIDTRFNVDSTDIGPLALVSLGFIPNKKAHVSATASLALFDVRTGYLYGVAESSATEEQRASVWSSEQAIDASRIKAEGQAYRNMLGEFDKLWKQVVQDNVRTARR